MSDFFRADTAAFDNLARQLRAAAHKATPGVDRSLAVIGAEHAELAKQIVSPHSQTIPPTIRVHVEPLRVVLTAGGPDAPLAPLYEKGNRRSQGRGRAPRFDSRRKGTKYTARGLQQVLVFKHPVFGMDVWVEERRFPFFAPAHRKLARKTKSELTHAWADALNRSGIRTEIGDG